jgi:peroxiredoxin-like protein
MTPLPHRYTASLSGRPAGYARISARGLPTLDAAPPPEFGGPGDAWTPEHLLLAAVETCYLFTLRAHARASQLQFLELDLTADGTVDREEGVTKFTEIVLRPRLVVGDDVPLDRVTRLLQRVEQACLVSASLSTPIRVHPEIVHEESLVQLATS